MGINAQRKKGTPSPTYQDMATCTQERGRFEITKEDDQREDHQIRTRSGWNVDSRFDAKEGSHRGTEREKMRSAAEKRKGLTGNHKKKRKEDLNKRLKEMRKKKEEAKKGKKKDD